MTPIDWLLSNDTGISSKTILSVMTGSHLKCPDVPYDPSDFGRCHRLLALFPGWRARLPEVAEQFPIWRPMVDAWDELDAIYEEEAVNPCGRSPRLYRRLQELLDDGRVAAGWKKTGTACWERP